MLQVKTKIKKSRIHGTGLFADQFIPKGATTWEYDRDIDPEFTLKTVKSLPQKSRDFLLYYTYLDKKLNKLVLCSDNQKYINHTRNKKLENISATTRKDVAARDIKSGEEMLCDYNKFDDSYFKRMKIDPKKLK